MLQVCGIKAGANERKDRTGKSKKGIGSIGEELHKRNRKVGTRTLDGTISFRETRECFILKRCIFIYRVLRSLTVLDFIYSIDQTLFINPFPQKRCRTSILFVYFKLQCLFVTYESIIKISLTNEYI